MTTDSDIEADSPDPEGTHTSPETGSDSYPGDSEGYEFSEDYAAPPPGDDDYDPWGFPVRRSSDEDIDPRGGWMPDEALEDAAMGSDGLEPHRREWQVNIRLDYDRYAELRAAADVYGTRPTTLARMLVNRGARAVMAAHRAAFLQDPED